MKIFVKRESWPKFLIKMAIVFALIYTAGIAFASRYRIGIDSQIVKCIPGYSLYLIDKKDTTIQRDKIFLFKAKGLNPFYEDDTDMVKYLRGLPGDTVEIQKNLNIYVNGNYFGYGLVHAETLGTPKESLIGKSKLKKDSYWFMGTSNQSFDSRYWGTVKYDQIVGRAYPLL